VHGTGLAGRGDTIEQHVQHHLAQCRRGDADGGFDLE
jgi:hypothetical protein